MNITMMYRCLILELEQNENGIKEWKCRKEINLKKYEKHIEKCKKVYEENKEWLIKRPFIFGKSFEEYDPERFNQFFLEYKRVGGKKDILSYSWDMDMFFKITFNSYIHGDMEKFEGSKTFWNDKQEVWNCLIGYLNSTLEAEQIFASIDNVHGYS